MGFIVTISRPVLYALFLRQLKLHALIYTAVPYNLLRKSKHTILLRMKQQF